MDTQHPTMQAALRAEEAATTPVAKRASVKQELESELTGLLMACRMHGFNLAVVEGQRLGIVETAS